MPFFASLLCAALAACGTPQAVGTKTNWLLSCTSAKECGEADCVCGICSGTCLDDSDCNGGTCGTLLSTAAACDGVAQGRLCLPKAETSQSKSCTEVPIPTRDAIGNPPALSCEVPGALLCENFDEPLSPEYRVQHVRDIETSIEDCRVHSGTGAIHFKSPGVGWTQVTMPLLNGVSTGTLHARFFAYIPADIPLSKYLIFLELHPDDAAERVTLQGVGSDQFEVFVGTSGTAHAAPANTLVRDQWQCLELSLALGPNGSLSLARDGTEVLAADGIDLAPTTPLSWVIASALPFTDAMGVDVTMDDLVVSTEPIGCN